tara:strand:- start:254 stop:445 length:192 start_codon:yes stop_codon:yes gene_type:complete
MKIQLEMWNGKYDNNNGYIYGINFLDDDDILNILDCMWFKTEKERQKVIIKNKLKICTITNNI